MWYPENKKELETFIDNSFKKKPNIKNKKINGIIVPHAGYVYSGEIAGKAFSLLKNKKLEKAIIIGPSHYIPLIEAATSQTSELKTPLGNITLKSFPSLKIEDISKEHSINNQIPFLQRLGIKEITQIMVGEITSQYAKELAKKIAKINAAYIFSTDLSHFMSYDKAKETDKKTITIIEEADLENFQKIDACGFFPLLVLFHLCKIKKIKPHLIEYKNSGDIAGDKSSVVGYASFYF